MGSYSSQKNEALSFEKFKGQLLTQKIGQTALFLDEVGSTNDYLAGLSEGAAPHGMVVAADVQLKGKGRLGRQWVAPVGSSLLFSTKFSEFDHDFPPTWMTMIAGVAVVRAVQSYCDLEIKLKWPNDLVVVRDDVLMKVGGILTEVQFEDAQLDSVVIGIGVNVNIVSAELPPSATPATSLLLLLNQPVERELLLAEILRHLELLFNRINQGNDDIVTMWKDSLITIGQHVTVSGKTNIVGIAETVDEWGQLGVRDNAGILHFIAAGDVTLRAK